MSPFDFVNDILYTKKNIFSEENAKDYVPFLINRSISYHYDCILYANEMNRRHHIDKKLQNDFLINTIRSRKRSFAKWVKPEKSENTKCVMQVYGMSEQKALEALRILNDDEIQQLKEQTQTGGLRN